MASLTIRNLDDSLKTQLRVRAARCGRSMEAEIRTILRQALQEPEIPRDSLMDRVRSRFEGVGAVDLPQPPREAMRDAPSMERAPRT